MNFNIPNTTVHNIHQQDMLSRSRTAITNQHHHQNNLHGEHLPTMKMPIPLQMSPKKLMIPSIIHQESKKEDSLSYDFNATVANLGNVEGIGSTGYSINHHHQPTKFHHESSTNTSINKTTSKTVTQNEAWYAMFNVLHEYKLQHGHCKVPQTYKENPKLGRWVHQQRVKKQKGCLCHDRIDRLESIGFVWCFTQCQWDVMCNRLINFKMINGHCIVPRNYKLDKQLGKWVNNQRLRKSNLPIYRIQRLNAIGFVWSVTKHKIPKTTKSDTTIADVTASTTAEEATYDNNNGRSMNNLPSFPKFNDHAFEPIRFRDDHGSSAAATVKNGQHLLYGL